MKSPPSSRSTAQDVHSLASDDTKILWALAQIEEWATASTVSDYLRDNAKVAISRQRVGSILDRAETAALVTHEGKGRRKAKGPKRYKIMQLGSDSITTDTEGCIYIDPDSAYTGIRNFETLIASLNGDLRICDPYLSHKSLDYFAQELAATSIKILSHPIQKPNPFRRDLSALKSEHSTPVEVRIHAHGSLHDRYIIHDNGLVLLGTSLNGLGKKQSVIVESGTNLRETVAGAFDQYWQGANAFS